MRLSHLVLFLVMTSVSMPTWALNSGLTLSGRILEPDNVTPITGSTQFKMQIRTPDSSNCVMYEEWQSVDLTGTDGSFSITINDGLGIRQDSTGLTLDEVFANRNAFTFSPSACTGSTTYTPAVGDGRNLSVTFKSMSMNNEEPMPLQAINFAPLAIEAQQVSGFPAASLLRFAKSDGTLVNTSPLNDVEYAALTALVDGTSGLYAKPGDAANGTSIYTTAAPSGITSTAVGDMWLDTSVAGSDSLKINTDSGVKTIPLTTAGSLISSITAGTGLAVMTTGTNATIGIAPSGVTSTELASNSVVASKIASGTITDGHLSPSINMSTSGSVAANSITTKSFAISNTSANSVTLYAPSSFTSYSLTMPTARGLNGQVLTTDGSGNLNWSSSAMGALASGQIFIGSASNAPTAFAVSGDATLSASGALTVDGLRGTLVDATTPLDAQVLGYSGSGSKWQPQYFSIGSLRTSTGATQFANASCNMAQTLTWSSLTDAFTCAPIAIAGSAITSGMIDPARLPASASLWLTDGTNTYRASGNVGIGTTAPVAKLNIAAGSATVAPLMLTPGVNLTTPLAGAIEFDGTNLYYTDSTAARKTLSVGGSGTYLPLAGGTMTGAIVHANGTVGAPSLSFANDTTSGLYAPTVGVVGIGTAGTERIRITQIGNVGIGTTAPGAALDVNGTLNLSTGRVTSAGSSILSISSAATTQNTFVGSNTGTTLTGTGIVALGSGALSSTTSSDNSSSTAVGANAMGHSTGISNTGVGLNSLYSSSGSGNVAFGSNAGTNLISGNGNTFLGSSAGSIISSGNSNVLIGTQAGSNMTSGANNIIIGALAATNFTSGAGNIVIGANAPLAINANNTMSLGGAIYATNLTTTAFVGIGTTAPAYKLDVSGQINSSSGFSIAGVPISASGSSIWALNGSNTYNTNSGNVGIGTDVPVAPLHTVGNVIHMSGNVGIGTTTPQATLDVSGSAKLGSAGVAITGMGACTVASFTATNGPNVKTCTGLPTGSAVNCSPTVTQGGGTVWSAFASNPNEVTIMFPTGGGGNASIWYCMWVRP